MGTSPNGKGLKISRIWKIRGEYKFEKLFDKNAYFLN